MRHIAFVLTTVLFLTAATESDGADCRQWNTEAFFRSATAADVIACLAAGANPKAKDKDNNTPLHYAAMHSKDPESLEALLNAGGKKKMLRRRNRWGWMPLHLAAKHNGNPAVLKLMIDAGADLRATEYSRFGFIEGDYILFNPLHFAAAYNNQSVVMALLDAGADPNSEAMGRVRPLHVAAEHNPNQGVVAALLSGGADLAALDKKGRTAYSLAKSNNRADAQQSLKAAGAEKVERQIAAPRAMKAQSGGARRLGALLAGAAVSAISVSGGASAEEAASAGATITGDIMRGQRASPGLPSGEGGGGVLCTDMQGAVINCDGTPIEKLASSPAGASTSTGEGGSAPLATSGPGPSRRVSASDLEPCEIAGYPRPANPRGLGLRWCPSYVDFQVRVFAIRAAGAKCALSHGSTTPAQIQARRNEIAQTCQQLKEIDAATGGRGTCRCPEGY